MYLSKCCGAKIIGELWKGFGRCGKCKEMSEVFVEDSGKIVSRWDIHDQREMEAQNRAEENLPEESPDRDPATF